MSRPVHKLLDPIPKPDQETINKHVWFDIDNAFSRPVNTKNYDTDPSQYWLTQVLAELFRSEGFDGVIYKSRFGEERGYQ